MLNNFRIGQRLGGGFAIIISLSIITCLFCINYMNTLAELTATLYRHPYSAATAVLRIDANIVRMHRSMRDVIIAENETDINTATTAVAKYERKVYKDLSIAKERFLGDQKHIEEFLEFFEEWKPIREETIRLMLAGKKQRQPI